MPRPSVVLAVEGWACGGLTHLGLHESWCECAGGCTLGLDAGELDGVRALSTGCASALVVCPLALSRVLLSVWQEPVLCLTESLP